jgi:transposase
MINRKADFDFIQEITDYQKSQVYQIRSLYELQGIQGLHNKIKRQFLTKHNLLELGKTLKQAPRELGYESDFWTVNILDDLIQTRFKVKYKSKTSLRLIFKKNHFSFHKPEQKYAKYDPEKVELWKQTHRQVIKEYFENYTIITEDEAIIKNTTTTQAIWAEVGTKPYIKITAKKENKSLYGFLNLKTGAETIYDQERQNSQSTLQVLQQHFQDTDINQKTLLLWDNAPWHTSALVTKWLEDKGIKVINYTPYSPELNPQEHVWKEMRRNCLHNKYITDLEPKIQEIKDYTQNRKFNYKILEFRTNVDNLV